MSVLELTDEQVVSLVRQLPAARKRAALLYLGTFYATGVAMAKDEVEAANCYRMLSGFSGEQVAFGSGCSQG